MKSVAKGEPSGRGWVGLRAIGERKNGKKYKFLRKREDLDN